MRLGLADAAGWREGGRVVNVKRGDVVAWWQEPGRPLKVMSDPYSFNGKETVTVQRVCKKRLTGSRCSS